MNLLENVLGIAIPNPLGRKENLTNGRNSKPPLLNLSLRASTRLEPNHTNQDHSGLGHSLFPGPQTGDVTEPNMVSELQLDLSRSPAERDNERT